MTQGARPERPKVTLKLASSLDGRIATSTGNSQWISGPQAREEVHRMRAAHDAVLVGSGTALADDPLLTARTQPSPAQQPVRIVADSQLRTPLTSRLVSSLDQGPVVLAVGVDVEEDRFDDYLRKGVEIWELPIAPMGGVSVSGLLHRCLSQGIRSIFLEGGGTMAASFLKANAVDHIEWFRAPMILGGDGAPSVAALGLDLLEEATRFNRVNLRTCGPDIWETYSVAPKNDEG